MDHELGWYMRLFAPNFGILVIPFLNLALVSLETSQADVDQHTQVLREGVVSLFS